MCDYMEIYNSKLLSINAKITNNFIELYSEGILSIIIKPILNKINNIFKNEKAVKVDNDKIIFSSWIPPFPSIQFNRMIRSEIEYFLLKKRIPDQLSISVTSKCPNKCIHCGAFDFMNKNNNDISIEKIKEIVQQSIELGSYLITIDGGDPNTRKDIHDLIKSINNEKIILSMFTSGYNITYNNALNLKNAGLYSLKISLDSTKEEKHDFFRGRKGSYNEVISAIKNSKRAGILTDLYLTLSPYNIDELESFYDLGSELLVDEITLTGIIAIGKWKDHEEEVITKNDLKKIEQFHIIKNKLKNGPRISALPYLFGKKMFGCFAGRRWIHITNNGDAIPCPYTPIVFGNIYQQNLNKIWENMRNSSIYKNDCYECRMRNLEFRKKYINK